MAGGRKAIPNIPEYVAKGSTPAAGKIPAARNWRFGFRFWKQIEFFGLSRQDTNWFVSLLGRLHELSAEPVDALDENSAKRDFYRYHRVNWLQHNIPIQRKDLDWLPSYYLDNADEYPIYQFTISQALGRVAGFKDENDVFQIVLLDPLHNLQPVKKFDYRVDGCWPIANRHEQMLGNLRALNERVCADADCPLTKGLRKLEEDFQPKGVVYVPDEILGDALKLIQEGKIKSLEDLFELNLINKA